uniref:HDC05815 n=1 Tax=Drosophila melanogaster TaxID=7227 RepID=Q6IGP0_DROME|nr:TPA_inf: HDC05815 [Drosophila melanogaster]
MWIEDWGLEAFEIGGHFVEYFWGPTSVVVRCYCCFWSSDVGRWTLDVGRWTLDTGHWTLVAGRLSKSNRDSDEIILQCLWPPICGRSPYKEPKASRMRMRQNPSPTLTPSPAPAPSPKQNVGYGPGPFKDFCLGDEKIKQSFVALFQSFSGPVLCVYALVIIIYTMMKTKISSVRYGSVRFGLWVWIWSWTWIWVSGPLLPVMSMRWGCQQPAG